MIRRSLFVLNTQQQQHTINRIVSFSQQHQQQQIRSIRRVPNKKVIILKDYAALFENDIVNVKAGYMRNVLYPRGVAQYATPENLQQHQEKFTVCLVNYIHLFSHTIIASIEERFG
jgi:hypothetical protein